MHQAADIRAQIAADALLQREISHALLAIADTLPAESDLRVVRILTRTLEASWIEHVSFQDGVLFPILVSRHGVRVQDMIDRGRSEHASLSQFHARIGDHLDGLLQAGHEPAEGLETLLRTTHADRLSHFALDAELDEWLPETFNDAECSLCEKWSNARPSLRFPLDLLLKAGRSFPRSGGQLH